MTKDDRKKLIDSEIEACTDLIRRTWDIPALIRNGTSIDLREAVTVIFGHAADTAKNLFDTLSLGDDCRVVRNGRRDFLKQSFGGDVSKSYFCDGIYEAICHLDRSLEVMQKAHYSSLANRMNPVVQSLRNSISGFGQCAPKDFSKFLELYSADKDVAHDFSMGHLERDIADFKGLSGDILVGYVFPELNTQWNIAVEMGNGRPMVNSFIGNIFRHAELVERHCNHLEIIAEYRQIDTRAPFTNEMVTFDTPWAKLAVRENPEPARPPERIPKPPIDGPKLVIGVEEQARIEAQRQEKSRALVESIYGKGP